jgi:thiol-disulfide isomerase/thioredoxin
MAGKFQKLAIIAVLALFLLPMAGLAAEKPAPATKPAPAMKPAPAAKKPAVSAVETPAPAAEKPAFYKTGDTIDDFTMKPLKGDDLSFKKDILGKKDATLLMFMTTVCSACQGEIAAVDKLTRKYGEKMAIYAVAVDMRGEATVGPYAAGNDFKVTYILDPKFTLPRLFNLSYTPSVVMIDKTGKIVFMKGGYAPGDEEMLQEKVLELVRK